MNINDIFKNLKYNLSKEYNKYVIKDNLLDLKDYKINLEDYVEISEEDSDVIDAYLEEMGEDIPRYESKLPIDTNPVYDSSVKTPEPLIAGFSILDKSVNELTVMDRDLIRAALMQEIESIRDWPYNSRNAQLQKIFGKIIDLEPTYKDDFIANNVHSHAVFVDLISTPELNDIPFVYNFLKYNFHVTETGKKDLKRLMLLNIFDYYETHSKEAIDKFNYILRGSNNVALTLLKYPDFDYEGFFSERILGYFDKEDLCQLFRFYFENTVKRKELASFLNKDNEKGLFLVSEMTKKVKEITGHGSEFIESAMTMYQYDPNFKILLDNIYDSVVGGKENEAKFSKTLAQTDNFILIHNLINYIIFSQNDTFAMSEFTIKYALTAEEFNSSCEKQRTYYHNVIFGEAGYKNFIHGFFYPEKDFPKITNKTQLDLFKEAYLYNVYGISVEEAEHLKLHYSKYLKHLDGNILEEDERTLKVLKAINQIYDLDLKSPNFKDQLRVLQNGYYDVVKRKGLSYQTHMASSVILEGLLNRMFMNTYNKRLMKVKDTKVIGVEDGVVLVEPGDKFDIILTSFSGAGEFYTDNVNMAEKWNTSALGTYQGLCASHISNSNLGVIDLESPMIGFSNIPKDGLNAMGSSDIYTAPDVFNLRRRNDSRQGENRYFIPGHMMSDETRFGYNEILLDRFLMTDPDGKLKLQPDYVVYYKIKDNVKNDKLYRQSLKVAKDFNIPLVVVDIQKVKEREKEAILKMEEELLSKEEVNSDLLFDIVTRYMNNYTGSLTMKPFGYEEDFSVGSMRRFFNLTIKHINKIEDKEKRMKWINALEKIYEEERKKYRDAKKVTSYKMSVKKFILKSFNLENRINDLKTTQVQEKKESTGFTVISTTSKLSLSPNSIEMPRKTFFMFEDFTTEKFSVIEFFEQLKLDGGTVFYHDNNYNSLGDFGTELESRPTADKEMALIENLVISYLFENCNNTCVTDLSSGNPKINVSFGCHEDYDWNSRVISSSYVSLLDPKSPNYIKLNPEKLDYVIKKIESMSEKRFLGVFSYLIDEHSKKAKEDVGDLNTRLLDKKSCIGDAFSLLKKQVKALENGDNPLNIGTGKKQ